MFLLEDIQDLNVNQQQQEQQEQQLV